MRDTNKYDSQASTLTSLVNSLSVVFAFTTFLSCCVEGTATCKYLYGMLPVVSPTTTTFHVRAAIHFCLKTVTELS